MTDPPRVNGLSKMPTDATLHDVELGGLHDLPSSAGQLNGNHVSNGTRDFIASRDDTNTSSPSCSVEPIAIIGIGCRLPGGASDPSKLWDLLAEGKSAWSEVPKARFNMEGFHDSNNPYATTNNTFGGHFLTEDVAAFDASFFGISSLEASAIDPQQRLLMEIAFEAFENAGVSMTQLSGSNTGVYVGQWSCDYAEILARDPEYPALYHTTGAGPAITSNRISYFFNLRGPSFTVDTGCSASLVALHNAVQSLRSGETKMSFVGGVNLVLDPQRFAYQSKLKMFSPDGRSFSFDSRANGYGRGEGSCGVVLKPLSAALKDNDRIRAVIRNSALNQDGRTPGISVPSGQAQEDAIRAAYAGAGLHIDPDYVEAHGTGTSVGDPIEVGAIASVVSKTAAYSASRPLVIGSIKGNVGHTESAAGLAGLVKSVLMLEKQCIPPQVNYENPSSKIPLDAWNLQVPTRLERRNLRRISVNSFGYGGTNAHVILDRADDFALSPSRASITQENEATQRPRIFIVSASHEDGCRIAANRLAEYVTQHRKEADSDLWLDDLAYTVNRRSIHRHRSAVLAYDRDDLLAQLAVLGQISTPAKQVSSRSRVAYVFSGQGAQYYNMGRELIQSCRQFTESLQRANKHLQTLGCQWDLIHELLKDADLSRVDLPSFGQPISTAIQMALVDTLTMLGVTPAAVVGHSSGEIAAAYAADALSFEDAMTVSYCRGQLTGELLQKRQSSPGAMIAVGAAPAVAEEHIRDLGDESCLAKIACYNSPKNVTISGDASVIERLALKLEANGLFNRILRTNGAAYHSDQMREIAQEYHDSLQYIQPRAAALPMISSVTGKKVDGLELTSDYWMRNLVSPVHFSDALKRAACESESSASSVEVFLEIGAHSQLSTAVKQTLETLDQRPQETVYLCCLKRKADAYGTFLTCLADLYSDGVAIDIHLANNGFEPSIRELLCDVPRYPFNHQQTYWHESRLSKEFRNRRFLPHELLGDLSGDKNGLEPTWRRYIRLKELPWLQNHLVQGQIVFPAAGYLAMALEAIRRRAFMQDNNNKIASYSFRNISFGKALVISEDKDDHEIAFSLRPEAQSSKASSNEWMEFRVFTTASNQAWIEHCRGRIKVNRQLQGEGQTPVLERLVDEEDKAAIIARSMHSISAKRYYYLSKVRGLEWYEPFNNLSSIRSSKDTCFTVAKTPESGIPDHNTAMVDYVIHPAMLDSSLFHGICAILYVEHHVNSPVVPTFIKSLIVSADFCHDSGSSLNTYAISHDNAQTFNAMIGSQSGTEERLLLRADGMTTTKLPGSILEDAGRKLCHTSEWVTYCEAMTSKRLDEVCKKALTTESAAESTSRLNAAAVFHVRQALKQIKPEQVAQGHQQAWYSWMQTLDTESRVDVPQDSKGSTIDLGVPEEMLNSLGPNLPALLTGTIDPMSLMLQNNLLSKIYSEFRNERCYLQIKAYCAELGLQNPALKILEIGGGTASASFPILEALSRDGESLISRYDFTDVSPGFIESAKERLGSFGDIVRYEVLDIERDPATQGFEEGTYDVIVACNVVHATQDVKCSLDHAQALLRPGGTFVLMEITQDIPYYNLVFGAFPGWWTRSTHERATSPLLSEAEWIDVLGDRGFIHTMPCLRDYEVADGGTLSIFISKAPELGHDTQDLPVHIIGDPRLSAQQFLALQPLLSESLKDNKVSSASLTSPIASHGGIAIMSPEICESLSGSIDEQGWNFFQRHILSSKAVLLLTRGSAEDCSNPDGGLILGFARSFRLEHPDIRCITLDFDVDTTDNTIIADVLRKLLSSRSFDLKRPSKDVECEFLERRGQLYVSRTFHEPMLENHLNSATGHGDLEIVPFLERKRPLRVELGITGLLETFRWIDDSTTNRPVSPDEVRFEMRATSINFRDVLVATGQVEGLVDMKNDCSGIVTEVGENMLHRYKPGDRICSYYAQSYNNFPIVHGECCSVIPDNMSFELAASLPIVWATAYYSLVDIGRLRRGERVLIHAGAGAVGQAAIVLAHHLGAEVFTTAGSLKKQQMLVEDFGVAPDHVFSSRTTDFGRSVKKMTDGKGVDVILNSLSGELFRESCDVLRAFGRFIEIGKKDFLDDALMPTKFLLRNITFACVDLTLMIDQEKLLVNRLLQEVVRLISSGTVKPTMITAMPITEIETAFRQISAGKHVGKIVLTVSDNQHVKALVAKPRDVELHADALYMVVGGLGGLGRSVITWMADRGARTILTVSRSGLRSESAIAFIEEMKQRGVSVIVRQCDIGSREQLQNTLLDLEQEQNLPRIRGLIHSAMSLEDATFEAMTFEQWQQSLSSKVSGTWNLHNLLPPDLEFFVLLSSIVSICGHIGQSNYSSACAFQDAFAHYRRAQGRAAYSINIGPVSDSGFVSENPHIAATMRRQGFDAISTIEVLAQINYVLTQSSVSNKALRCQSSIGLVPTSPEARASQDAWFEQIRHRHLALQSYSSAGGANSSAGHRKGADMAVVIRAATTLDDAETLVTNAILQQLSKLLATPIEQISPTRSLDNYGVDSLVAVELRNWIAAYLQANVPLLVLRETRSIQELASIVTRESRYVQVKATKS